MPIRSRSSAPPRQSCSGSPINRRSSAGMKRISRVSAVALLGLVALSIAGCEGGSPQSSAGAAAPAAVPSAPPGAVEPGSAPPGPLPPGPPVPTATLRVGFGTLVDTIEISAIQPQPLRAAALVAPDGTLV